MSRTFAAACLAALLLAACGGSDKPQADPTTTPPPAEATAAASVDPNGCKPARDPGPKDVSALEQPSEELDPAKTYVATVETNCGTFEITLDVKRAPKTSASFKYLADLGFYDGLLIHRIVPGFVFQGGDPAEDGKGGPGYEVVEAPPKDFKYEKYTVAMAKTEDQDPGTSGSQFFVVTGKDGEQLEPDYALLGEVTGGQEVADKIGAIITDPRSDFPEAPVVIRSIKVAEA